MRSVGLICALFVLVSLIWTIQVPFSAYALIQSLGDGSSDCAAVEETLRHSPAAVPALKDGLNSRTARVRLRCARVLALRDEPVGEEQLLEALQNEDARAEDAAAIAEVYLLSVWDLRDGPTDGERARLAHAEETNDDPIQLKILKELLAKYPRWISGYVRRAKLYQRNGEALEARRDTLLALLKQPSQFEAMVLLEQIDLSINATQDAYLCMEQAVRVNPRLRHDQRDGIREIIRALNGERDRQRRERRREAPVI